MEETVGLLWHRLITRAAGGHFPKAAVRLRDIEKTAGVFFRALGGDPGLRLAAATTDLFQGPNVVAIEKIFKKSRGLPETVDHHYFQEIIVNSENLIHVFLRGKTNPEYVAVFVCRKTANLGMALTKARLAMPALEAAF